MSDEKNNIALNFIANSAIGKMILKKESIISFPKLPNKTVVDNKVKEPKTKESRPVKKEPKLKNKFWHDNAWKEGIRVIGATKYFYRSSWEANYARYLEHIRLRGHIKGWQHEPDTFYFSKVKRGLKAYIPDFKVFFNDGTFVYHEVKGYMDSKAKTKLKRFAKYYPQYKLEVIDNNWFLEFRKSGLTLDGWE